MVPRISAQGTARRRGFLKIIVPEQGMVRRQAPLYAGTRCSFMLGRGDASEQNSRELSVSCLMVALKSTVSV